MTDEHPQGVSNVTIDMSYPACRNFIEWYYAANGGDKFVYYAGSNLASSQESWAVKNLVWKFAIEGKVYLFQKRFGNNDYQYIAIKAIGRDTNLVPLDYGTRSSMVGTQITRRASNGKTVESSNEALKRVTLANYRAARARLLNREREDGDGGAR